MAAPDPEEIEKFRDCMSEHGVDVPKLPPPVPPMHQD